MNEGDVRTRVAAFGKDGISVTVDSPFINEYVYPKILVFEDESAATTAQLRQKALELFREDEVDLPKINIKVDFLPLAKTEEYREFAALEEVRLGDTVTVINTRMGFSKRAKVISYKWDSLREQYESVELGDFLPTLATAITSGVRSYSVAASANAEAKNAIALISGRIAVTEQNLYVAIDTADYLTANRLFRFGAQGLQFGENGVNGTWKTLISPDGTFVLDGN